MIYIIGSGIKYQLKDHKLHRYWLKGLFLGNLIGLITQVVLVAILGD